MNDGGDCRFRYIRGSSTAGFICCRSGEQRFMPVWAEPDSPDFFPRNCTICTSTAGLLLCCYPDVTGFPFLYSVCNPYLHLSTSYIPNLDPPHPDRIPRALVVFTDPASHRWVFHIVCALAQMEEGAPVYTFEVYSSSSRQWVSSTPQHNLGFIREETGVSCDNTAYWLLCDSPFAVSYNAHSGVIGAIHLPDTFQFFFWRTGIRLHSQLGELRNRLCLVAATENWRSVFCVGEDYTWNCIKQEIFNVDVPVPSLSRFQDYGLLVPLWFDDDRTLVIWESSWAHHTEREVTWVLRGREGDLGGAEILPLVHTEHNPSLHFLRWELLFPP